MQQGGRRGPSADDRTITGAGARKWRRTLARHCGQNANRARLRGAVFHDARYSEPYAARYDSCPDMPGACPELPAGHPRDLANPRRLDAARMLRTAA